jgi:hypothetical protein
MLIKRVLLAGIASAVLAAASGYWWLTSATDSAATTQTGAKAATRLPPPAPPTSAVPLSAAAALIPAQQGLDEPKFDTTNLYSAFQLAQSSSDPKVLEKGLAAWRSCAGYVGLGSWDLETWVNYVLPEGLPISERDRRAKRGRASALRCAGFAGQTQAMDEAEALGQRARELGSAAELLHHSIFSQPASPAADKVLVARLSCDVVKTFPNSVAGVRLIGFAMRNAAASRADHLLNSLPIQSRNVAINLAFCDLDPVGCSAHSNFVGSACMQSGECSYSREEQYWQSKTKPEIYEPAQALRHRLVQSVKQHDCRALFE